ncbi:hypothetical protein [Stutzerimonas nitrititolerans]|uniref:hypothetical protein n=1 Tax=Stutzerimonas nitrititolerans TaxID=2482751 RepID=UPI00030D86A4|nr:hypothetical protein [Stutzerimonas nitrititolerans]SUD86124.1 Uncharacterised protein [Stutzerimonas stutzeri]
MTTEILAKARKSYLSSLKDPQATSALLIDLLDQAEKQTPEILSTFEPGTGKNALAPDAVSWSAEYFSRHILLTEQNFARERIEHLLAVREHLRKQGVKGFVPAGVPFSTPTQSARNVTSNYVPSVNLQKFVREGDLLTIRTALRLELNDNSLTSADLRAALAWTKGQVTGLLEAFVEKSFARSMESDQKVWTSQYYEHQVVYLKTNFAEDRFLHLIEVRDLLRQQGVEGFAAVPPKPRANTNIRHTVPTQTHHQSNQSWHNGPQPIAPESNPAFKAALLVGGALAALVVFLIALVK